MARLRKATEKRIDAARELSEWSRRNHARIDSKDTIGAGGFWLRFDDGVTRDLYCLFDDWGDLLYLSDDEIYEYADGDDAKGLRRTRSGNLRRG